MAKQSLKKKAQPAKMVKVASKPKSSSVVAAKKKQVKASVKSAVKSSVKSSKVIPVSVASKKVENRTIPAKQAVIKKSSSGDKVTSLKSLYKVGNHVVYPTHGVGKIMAEETQSIGDVELRMLVISFEKDRMTLRVPMSRATAAGLRPISNAEQMKKMFVTLKSKARTSRGMWSRRAQEYETKINSGNILLVAEVVRDLHQNVDQSERSYSERMIYESALSRLVGELAACEGVDYKTANDKLMKLLRSKVAAATNAAEAVKEAA